MGNKVVRHGANGMALLVDDTEYKLTPGLFVLTTNKQTNIRELVSGKPMVIKYINHSLHRPRLNHSRIWQVLLDHTLHGNGERIAGKR